MIVRWRQPAPPVATRWRGPDGRVTAAAQASPMRPIASVIGPPGRDGAETTPFIHEQGSADTLWIINHNKGFRPYVEVLSPGGQVLDAGVQHNSVNQVQISFNQPTLGSAILR